MDEQVDGKMLVGTYVCTEQPGEFRWQPGSLTQVSYSFEKSIYFIIPTLSQSEDYYDMQAVSNGFWVVFEDVDKAPPDVQCILLPLLEGTTSFFTGHGEVLWNIVSICSRRSHAYPLMLFTAFSFVWIC